MVWARTEASHAASAPLLLAALQASHASAPAEIRMSFQRRYD
jgi:hypothetical protein